MFYFITIANEETVSAGILNNMLESANPIEAKFKFILVLQGVSKQNIKELEKSNNFSKIEKIILLDKISPASYSRNLALNYIANKNIENNSIIAFPDDDAWFYPQVLADLNNEFKQNPELDGIFTSYGPTHKHYVERFSDKSGEFNDWRALRDASMITMFIRYHAIKQIGLVDETFGGGAIYKNAEDGDYALRFIENGFNGIYKPKYVMGHKFNTVKNINRYFLGNILMLIKHIKIAPRFSIIWMLLIRIIFGFKRVVFKQIKLSIYLFALKAGVKELFSNRWKS